MLGTLEQLADYVKQDRVDLIYITLPMASQPRILRLLDALRDTTASIYFVPDIFMFDLIQARMDAIGGIPWWRCAKRRSTASTACSRRSSDYVLAIADPGAGFAADARHRGRREAELSVARCMFKQRRYGLDGQGHHGLQVPHDDAYWRTAIRYPAGDARMITRATLVGRASCAAQSLDELPQFVNVLQGRMSIVGPRPHAVAHNETYRKLIKGYMIRHKVKPGITGWAQVNGLRGETDTVEKMQERIEYDLAYLRNWSLRLDLQIIVKTVLLVFFDRKAY